MGHYIGRENVTVYISDNLQVYTGDDMAHKLADSVEDWLNDVSLIGAPMLQAKTEDDEASLYKCTCGFVAKSRAGLGAHKHKTGHKE